MLLSRPRPDESLLRSAIDRRTRLHWLGALAQAGFAGFFTFFFPLFIAWALTFNPFLLGLIALGTMFSIGLSIGGMLMALAYFLEWRTRGEWLVDSLRAVGPSSPYSASTKGQNRARSATLFMEILLFVPRTLFNALATMGAYRRVGHADRGRAAALLADLLEKNQGVPTHTLQRRDEPELAFSTAVVFLLQHDWIGSSEYGDRLWALTDAKKEIEERAAARKK